MNRRLFAQAARLANRLSAAWCAAVVTESPDAGRLGRLWKSAVTRCERRRAHLRAEEAQP